MCPQLLMELASCKVKLAAREEEVRKLSEFKKNWPACCPIISHNIARDVDKEFAHAVRAAYLTYLALLVGLFFNVLASFAALIELGDEGLFVEIVHDTWEALLWQAMFALCFFTTAAPGAFIFWYYPLYRCASPSVIAPRKGWRFAFLCVRLGTATPSVQMQAHVCALDCECRVGKTGRRQTPYAIIIFFLGFMLHMVRASFSRPRDEDNLHRL